MNQPTKTNHGTAPRPDANCWQLGRLVSLGLTLADQAALADIEAIPAEPDANGAHINDVTIAWRDTTAMVSPEGHAPEVVDMATLCLQYAEMRRLIARHPFKPHLVRITRRST